MSELTLYDRVGVRAWVIQLHMQLTGLRSLMCPFEQVKYDQIPGLGQK